MLRLPVVLFSLVLSSVAAAATVAEQIVNAPWVTKTVGRGVIYKQHHFTSLYGAPQDVYIVEANLNTPGVTVRFPHATGGTRYAVSTFAGTMNGSAAAVVNGQFFDAEGSTQYLRVNNTLVNTSNAGANESGAIGVDSADVTTLLRRPSGGWGGVTRRHLMACGPVLVANGAQQTFVNDSFAMGRHPRTAVGITGTNRLLVVTVDGRSTNAAGMTLPELAQIFTAYSATTAINFDGGGSTTAWVRGEDNNGIVNNPSDGRERTVTNAIAVVAPPADVVVDSTVVASTSWTTGTSAADKYGSDYRFHATEPVSDPAIWTWTALQTRNYEVYAWWSQGVNRSATAPYLISHSGGSTSVSKNQQINGGSWQSLGIVPVAAGTNTVRLSCWTTPGYVVIADAIKLVAR